MFTAETDVLPNTTQEAKHRKNNSVLNVNLTCGLEALAVFPNGSFAFLLSGWSFSSLYNFLN